MGDGETETPGAKAAGADHEKRTALHAVCWPGDSLSGNTLEQRAETLAHGDHTSGSIKCVQIIEMLLAAGANVSAPDVNHRTALHEAVSGDWANATAVRTLLRYGAVIDSLNARGETPLMVAVGPGRHQAISGSASKVACTEMLIEAGADPTLRNDAGSDVLCLATDTVLMVEDLAAAGPIVHFRPTPAKLARAQRRLQEAVLNARKCVTLIENALRERSGG